jgi:hypothetical protein
MRADSPPRRTMVPPHGQPHRATSVLVRCDWCGRMFKLIRWKGRTCGECAEAGAPDQARFTWPDYQRLARGHLRRLGRRARLTGTALRIWNEGVSLTPAWQFASANSSQVGSGTGASTFLGINPRAGALVRRSRE